MTIHSQSGRVGQPVLPPPDDPALTAFMAIVDRLEGLVDAENETLTSRGPDLIGETGQRKRQGMLEMDRVMRVLAKTGPHHTVRERLDAFAQKLEHNRRLLDVHLRAVREVADIIARTMREAESDGTYSLLVDRL